MHGLTWYGEKDANIFQRFGNKQYLKGGLECTCVCIPLGRLGLGTLDLPRKHEQENKFLARGFQNSLLTMFLWQIRVSLFHC